MLKNQAVIALIGLAALETLFAAMARLGDLKLHVIETIVLALAAGVVYFVALYALEHTRKSRRALADPGRRAALSPDTVPAAAFAFHRPVPLPLGRPRPKRGLEPLRDQRRSTRACIAARSELGRHAGPEVPAIYPPLAELIFRATARITHEPGRLQAAVPAGRPAGGGDAGWVAAVESAGGTTSWLCTPGVRWSLSNSPPAATATRSPSRFWSLR